MDERVDMLRENLVLFNRKIRRQTSSHQLTPTQVQALAHLDRVGPMSARAVADLEMVAPQTIARTVTYLEQEGLVSRTVDPNDARAALISVTTAGHQTLERDRGRRSEWLTDVLEQSCSPVERELLFLAGSLLRRIAEESDLPRRPTRQR